MNKWKEDLAEGRISDTQYRQQAEEWLDKGMGACWLRDERIASMVQDALLYFDGTRYTLHGWVVMPNHVHVVFSPHEPHRLAEILHSWKSFTAKKANQILGRSGLFWQEDYFDRFMRDESDLNNTLTYLAYNPVVAGLSATPEQYPFAGGRASRPSDVEQCVSNDGRDARPPVDDRSLDEGGTGAMAYADAVAVYLGCALSKVANIGSTIATWFNIHRINASITIPFCLVTNQIEAVAACLDFIWWSNVRCDLASGESIECLNQAIVLSTAVSSLAEIKKFACGKSQIAAQVLVPLIKHGIGQPAHTVKPDILVAHGRKTRCAGGYLEELTIQIEASSL